MANTNERKAHIQRKTKETSIEVSVDLDGSGASSIETPISFLNHMLEQIARHGLIELKIKATGDTHIDGHHTTEDVAITLGQAVAQALGDKKGIFRYGQATLPMDEASATCLIDLCGRTFFKWKVPMPKSKVGDFDTELAEVFFEGFARGCACNLHMTLNDGDNLHHIIEICFKSFAKALRKAVEKDPRSTSIPSTKGVLGEESV